MKYYQTRLTGRHRKYFAKSITDYFDDLVEQKKAVEIDNGVNSYLLKDVYAHVSLRFKAAKGDIAVDSRGANVYLASQHSLDDVIKQLRKEFPQLKKVQ